MHYFQGSREHRPPWGPQLVLLWLVNEIGVLIPNAKASMRMLTLVFTAYIHKEGT